VRTEAGYPGWLEAYVPLCEAVVALLHPLAEIAVYDLRRDRLIAFWNPISQRRVGDRPPAGEVPAHAADTGVIGPYPRVLADGRAVTTVSVVLPGAKGAPRGLLSLSLDRSPLDGVVELLTEFAAPFRERPAERMQAGPWQEQIALLVDEECRSRRLRRDRLTREQRLSLVRMLDERGLFATRRAADHAARALRVSRTTIYALLKDARS
jgi:predicted transcriptional regulator YheO